MYDPDAPHPRGGFITGSDADGNRYVDFGPVPCQSQAELFIDATGEPFGLVIDRTCYSIRKAPRLKLRDGGGARVPLGRRLPPTVLPSD